MKEWLILIVDEKQDNLASLTKVFSNGLLGDRGTLRQMRTTTE